MTISARESSLPRTEAWAATVELEARLRSMVDDHRDFVAHALLGAGVLQSDLDDEVQRTFIVAARRLEHVQLGSERAFLYRVARHTALHSHRARARRREIPIDDIPAAAVGSGVFASPESLAQRGQLWTLLTGILDRMYAPWRKVFVLYALEGMPRNEIVALLKVPDGTVASRSGWRGTTSRRCSHANSRRKRGRPIG